MTSITITEENNTVTISDVGVQGPQGDAGAGGGAVTSVFGRTGAVVAANNDYDLSQVSETATYKLYTATEQTKLSGIETGAEVNNISDVNATDLTDSGDSSLHYHSTDRSRANHTGTQTASTISDFDAEVSNNTDVAANTSARHDAVSVADSAEIDFTLTGQQITASLKAGSIDETKLDTSTNASLDLADSSIQPSDNISFLTNDSGFIAASGVTYENLNANGDVGSTASTVAAGNDSRFVTGGDSHDHNGGDGAQIDHVNLSNKGTNTHAQIDTAITNSTNHISATTAHGATGAVVGTTNTQTLTNKTIAYGSNTITGLPVEFTVACSDLTTDLTTGTSKGFFRLPHAMTLTEVRASVLTAPTGSTITVDINESGTTVLSTKLTIDATEKTSETAATPPVISDSALADDAEITIDIDQVGSTTAGKGLLVTLIGTRA